MKRLLASALALIAATCAQTPLPVFAQDTTVLTLSVKYRSVVVDTASQRVLAAQWNDSSAYQPERGYCAAIIADSSGPFVHYGVYDVQPATIAPTGSPNGGGFDCEPSRVTLHTHPPTTCVFSSNGAMGCHLGGLHAYDCQPSFADILFVWKRHDPLGLIQCDRHAIVAFYPSAQFAPNRTQSQGQ